MPLIRVDIHALRQKRTRQQSTSTELSAGLTTSIVSVSHFNNWRNNLLLDLHAE